MQSQGQKFVIRAMPAMGFNHRWCAQRPWGKDSVEVSVVEAPCPPKEFIDGEGKKRFSYGSEISAVDLEELRRDPHISVSIAGHPDADPLEVNALKAKVHDLESKIVEVRKEYQGEIEELKAYRTSSMKQADEYGAKVVMLEQQLASANQQLADRGKRK